MEPPLHSGLVGRSPATLEKRVPINRSPATLEKRVPINETKWEGGEIYYNQFLTNGIKYPRKKQNGEMVPQGRRRALAVRRPAQGQRQLRLGAALHPPPRAPRHGRLRPCQWQHVLQPVRRRRHPPRLLCDRHNHVKM